MSPDEASLEARRLLARVQLPAALARRRPGELSGGEGQRVNIVRALAAGPRLLVCDEITSALDRETAYAVLGLLENIRREDQLAVLFITHDFDVVVRSASTVTVLERGRVVETGQTDRVLRQPHASLTRSLVAAAGLFEAAGPHDRLGHV